MNKSFLYTYPVTDNLNGSYFFKSEYDYDCGSEREKSTRIIILEIKDIVEETIWWNKNGKQLSFHTKIY